MEKYEGFEKMEIRWNGSFIMMVIEVPAVFTRGLNPDLVIRTQSDDDS